MNSLTWRYPSHNRIPAGQGIVLLKHAVERRPEIARLHVQLGTALRHVGAHEDALESFRRALDLEPEDANTYHELGYTLQSDDRYQEALEAYEHALTIEPQQEGSLFGRATMLEKLERQDEAVSVYRLVLDRKFDHAGARHRLAALHYARGAYRSALAVCDETLRLIPGDTGALARKVQTLAARG